MKLLLKPGQTPEQYQKELAKWNKRIKRAGHKEIEHSMHVGDRVEVSNYFKSGGTSPQHINWGKASLFRSTRLFLHHASAAWKRKLKYTFISARILDLYVNSGLTYLQIQKVLKSRATANKRLRKINKPKLKRKRKPIFKPDLKYTTWFISECLSHDFKIILAWVDSDPDLLVDDDCSFRV